ncbi:MAG: arginine N-succinyltransferase [Legionella sp.]|nr:arginine N-succinyltransferase [Legionella sp.]
MMLLRHARNTDLEAIYNLALHSGIGITTLPKDEALLKKRLQLSTLSFKTDPQFPTNEYYFFVLEDSLTKQLVGTSGIEANTGFESPFYSYKLSKYTRMCYSLNIRSDYEVLNLVNDHQGCSEMCTLYLEPNYRRNHNGLLLSKGRFLFMAQSPYRFSKTVIAEMRGVSDEDGESPFWDHLGSHFFHMSFIEADRLTLASDKQLIADLMPLTPIYVQLLNPDAQAVIGKPHKTSLPAMKILLKEGFRYNHYVDIFDAGPTIEAPLENIKSIGLSQLFKIIKLRDDVTSIDYLLANLQVEFRATLGSALIDPVGFTCIISKEIADLLQVHTGDHLRIVPLNTSI